MVELIKGSQRAGMSYSRSVGRPVKGDLPLDKGFNCKITKLDMKKLNDLSYILGVSKSQVVRDLIRLTFENNNLGI